MYGPDPQEIHRRTGKGFAKGILNRSAIEETLVISKSTFLVLLREYRRNPDEFSLVYHRETPTRIPAQVEKEFEREIERNLTDDSILPVTIYDCSAIRNRLAKRNI